ncbi:ATP-binding protein [Amycolatopsis magusensis]|uniref:Histidine kinase/HSP90-like ATPase domain-containing protein n=1 Tax=Amycolatopsis magusensis TaxID=882444 RepID=A0ABS4PX70_9PSEU|nr:ATP-binding protein [Amycolatopsis magusensis]MBP2184021.1 hypothetical protein [Amycolatopsis magusensis]
MAVETQSWGEQRAEPVPLTAVCDLDVTGNREVRQRIRDLLSGEAGLLVDDAVLVADELVSNAHRHGAPPRLCRFGLIDQRRSLRIEVDDASSGKPAIRPADATGGRGLLLVDRLASSWGVQQHGHHKTVWAELALDQPGSSGHAPHLAAAPRGPRPS